MFYVIEIATGDEKITGKAIYAYDTERKAVASFHKKTGTALDSELYETELCMVVTETGTVIKREYYDFREPVVVEEETEE